MSVPQPTKLTSGDQSFTVAVKPDLAVGTFVPWCVEVDGAWYEVGRYYDDDLEPPRAASRFIKSLQQDPAHRTPPWLANYEHPLLLSIGAEVIRCRVYHSNSLLHTLWSFEQDGLGSMGGHCEPYQTLADVRDLARRWLEGGS